jgi:hypothetical protein
MRKLSSARRRLAALASSVASMSAMGSMLLRENHRLGLVWMGVIAAMLVWVIKLMVRLRRNEGCA